MTQGTAVATTTEKQPVTAGDQVEQIRGEGAALVARRKELNKIYRQLEGLEWGNVKGASMSEGTLMAFAELVHITRANPQLHIDILGGKPYLNAQYWADRMNSDEYFIGYEQRNISRARAEQLRARAREAIAEAQRLAADPAMADAAQSLKDEAFEANRQAREIEDLRAEYGVPDMAIAAYETTIKRWAPGAPLAEIRSGAVVGAPYVQLIIECNWAPRIDKDPIGREEPAKTARTRSLRRAAVKAFSAWMVPLEKDIRRIEDAVEAEYRMIDAESRYLPPAAGAHQQVQTGSGEPQRPAPSPAAVEAANKFATDEEAHAAQKRFFGNLRDAGVDSEDRAIWARKHGLPESISSWGPLEHSRAIELLIGPERDRYVEACRAAGRDAGDFAQAKLGHAPEGLRDYQELNRLISTAGGSSSNPQGSLV